jgi:hypothetical protein
LHVSAASRDSDEVRIVLELYEEIVVKGIAMPRQIDATCGYRCQRGDKAPRTAAHSGGSMDAVSLFVAVPRADGAGNKFQQEVKALAEPRPHCRKPPKDPSRHEL